MKNLKFLSACFLVGFLSLAVMTMLNQKEEIQPPPPADIAPAETEQPAQQIYQGEIIYYDKSWYEQEIPNYTDVILPYNNSDAAYLDNTVFVGDSNTEGLALFDHLVYSNVIGKHSMPIQGVCRDEYQVIVEDNPDTEEDESQYITMIQAIAARQPARIIINFGTNNAGKDANAEGFASSYLQVLSQIKAYCPHTQIVIASVLPVCYERDYLAIRQDSIDRFNIALADICRENGYGFLNYNEVFKDSESGYAKDACFSADGVHLNGDGYRLLLDYAVNHQYNIIS